NREDQTISVKSRLGGNGVPDIAVLVESPDSAPSLLAIENKLLATEGICQTERYARPEILKGLARAFALEDLTREQVHGLYLSPYEEGEKHGFQALGMDILLPWLASLSETAEDPVRRLLATDLAQLVHHFRQQDWTPDGSALEALSLDPAGLGKSFLTFRQVFSAAFEGSLEGRTLQFWRGASQGNSYYGGKLTNETNPAGWFGLLDPSETRRLVSATTLEFQYDLATRTLALAVHFTTNPAKPEKEMEKLFAGRPWLRMKLAEHRTRITNHVQENLPADWTNEFQYLDIASTRLVLSAEHPVAAFQAQLVARVTAMSTVLDEAWAKLRP
ncbi:MAG: hypothetical protein RL318_2759, partial [Fibrobacterota bacterium]